MGLEALQILQRRKLLLQPIVEELNAKVPSGVIITGGGAETVGIVESAKRMTSLPVRVGKPKGIGGLIDDIITPTFATPVGLILYGTRQNASSESLTSFAKKFKLPAKGITGKIIESIKDLLP